MVPIASRAQYHPLRRQDSEARRWVGLRRVYADDLGRRILVGHVDGPDTRTSAEIKDLLRAVHDWRNEKPVFHKKGKLAVL